MFTKVRAFSSLVKLAALEAAISSAVIPNCFAALLLKLRSLLLLLRTREDLTRFLNPYNWAISKPKLSQSIAKVSPAALVAISSAISSSDLSAY